MRNQSHKIFNLKRQKQRSLGVLKLFIVGGLALSGCATPPPPSTSYSDLRLAAIHAIEEAVEAQTLFEACSQVGGELQQLSIKAKTAWQTQNWPNVVAADSFYRNELREHIFNYRDEELAIEALKLLAESQTTANNHVKSIKRSRTNRTLNCNKRLNQYLSGSKDLNWSSELSKGLSDFAVNHPAPPAPGGRVPSLAGSLDPLNKPGRSLFKIERGLADENCVQPLIFTFDNQWPNEMYGAFCGSKQYIYQCHWGECTVKE